MRSWSWTTPCATVGRRTRGASILGLAPPPTRRDQLAEFLRHHRERTSPESLGLPANGRRRTPGLRREEHAHLFDLAGVAVPAAEDYPTEAPAELRVIVEGLEPNPAYLIGPRTDVLV